MSLYNELLEEVNKARKEGRKIGKILKRGKDGSGIRITGMDNIMVRMAKCCNPIPGEEVIGYITRGRVVTIHNKSCYNVLEMDPSRIIEATWDLKDHSTYPVKIKVSSNDEKGLLAEITKVLAKNDVNILKARTEIQDDLTAINLFEIEIENLKHLKRVMNALKKVHGVREVDRIPIF